MADMFRIARQMNYIGEESRHCRARIKAWDHAEYNTFLDIEEPVTEEIDLRYRTETLDEAIARCNEEIARDKDLEGDDYWNDYWDDYYPGQYRDPYWDEWEDYASNSEQYEMEDRAMAIRLWNIGVSCVEGEPYRLRYHTKEEEIEMAYRDVEDWAEWKDECFPEEDCTEEEIEDWLWSKWENRIVTPEDRPSLREHHNRKIA